MQSQTTLHPEHYPRVSFRNVPALTLTSSNVRSGCPRSFTPPYSSQYVVEATSVPSCEASPISQNKIEGKDAYQDDDSEISSLSAGAIAGIAVGGALIVILLAFFFVAAVFG